MLEASIKIPKYILFCKQTCSYVHTKRGLVVRGHLAPFCMVFFLLPRKPIVCISNSIRRCLHLDVSIEYVTATVSLTESVFMHSFLQLKNDSKSHQTSLAMLHRAIKSI